MVAKEESTLGESIASIVAHNNANTATPTTIKTAELQQQQLSKDHQNNVYLPKASSPPQIVIIPATQASTVATNAARKIRRALSMPRNPFRWSRKFKTTASASEAAEGELIADAGSNSAITSCVGGGRGRTGSIVSLNSCDAIVCNHTNGSDEKGNNKETVDASNENLKIDKTIGKSVSGNDSPNAVGSGGGGNRIFRRSSFRKFLNRIAQHVSGTVNVGANKHASFTVSTATDRVPPIGSYHWPADQTPGVMGLKNHGNTCFMNAVLQCLSHTDILAEYFVLDQYKADLKRRNKINSRKFGTKGELTEQLANVLKALWTCKNESDHSTSFKAVVDRYSAQFRSSTQHDAQEFLFWLLDKVHEDLNTATKRRYKSVKNNYGRPDEVIAAETLANHIRCNNSFVQAVFQAQFRSSLTCPRCKKQSNTFDPFHCISVQLPQLTQQTIFVTVVYLKQQPRQLKLGLTVPAGSPIVALREQLEKDTGISGDHMVLADVNKEGFTRVFYDTQPVATLIGIETIYCIEVPEVKSSSNGSAVATITSSGLHSTNSRSKTNSTTNDTSTITTQGGDSNSGTAENKKSNISNITTHTADLLILVANVRKRKKIESVDANATGEILDRFGAPFSMQVPRDSSYIDLQKKLLREMSSILKPEVFSYATPLTDMFQIRLQDPSADPDTYLEQVEHPLLTEMIDLALSVLSAEAGPAHIKLLLEWSEPEKYFTDLSDNIVEHESVARLLERKPNDTAALTLEQCLEHYTKAETLSAEDAWRCPHCQQYLPVVKTLGLWSLPDILVVHFKRFRQHQEKGQNAAKLTTMVTFPLNSFDMSPHLARGPDENRSNFGNSTDGLTNSLSHMYRPSPWKKTRPGDSRSSTLNSRDNRETRYDLYAVCYHQGDTLETGHYTAACKNPYDHQWYKFDDQRVSKVPNESIENEIINNEAYMLFYQRRTGETSECSGSSSNSGDHWISRIAPPPQIPIEKLTLTNDKVEKSSVEVPPATATITTKLDQTPGKPEAKPVEIPKPPSEAVEIIDTEREVIKNSINVAPKESLAQMVVMEMNDEHLVDIEEIDYADADVVNGDDKSEDELEILERSEKENSYLNDTKQTIAIVHCNAEELDKPLLPEYKEADISNGQLTVNVKTSPLLPVVNGKPDNQILTNGFDHSPKAALKVNGLSNGSSINGVDKSAESNGSSSASSSTSSLSSRSSPHSLAVSVHGASTLQTKFNGYSGSFSSANHHYQKEALLSSSLKSNSSSIIGAAVVAAAHSQEFQLSRHQHHHWNGSRSSVSAVENATQQAQPHTHCLNLRHSFSTSSNYKLRECSETLTSMLRNSANTCSKDTLIFIDQQNHHHSLIEDDDDTFMGRSLWISPVTPHKLITVSPKN